MCFAPHGGIRHLQRNLAALPLSLLHNSDLFQTDSSHFSQSAHRSIPKCGFGIWGVWIDTQSAGFSVQLTSSPVELGISGRVSVGEDGRAGESCVGQRGRQSLVALFCRAGEGEGQRSGEERQERMNISIVSLHQSMEGGSTLDLSGDRPEPERPGSILYSSSLNNADFMCKR